MNPVCPSVTHRLTLGPRTIALMPEEIPTIVQGEIPPRLAAKLGRLGILLPPRGTAACQLEIRRPGKSIIVSEIHCRRAWYGPTR